MYEDIKDLKNIYTFRSRFIGLIRKYFNSKGVLEVDTPLLTPYFSHDLNISPLSLCYQNKRYYLATSPEFFLKRILAKGIGDVFEISHAFRNDPITPFHNPEFLLLEWYRVGWNYLDLVKDLKELLVLLSHSLSLKNDYIDQKWNILSLTDVFYKYTKISLLELFDEKKREEIARKNGYPDRDFETIFHKLFLTYVEPYLGKEKPTVIYDYPEILGGFAKNKESDPRFTERIELYLDGIEIANGYTEITNPEEQLKRWKEYKKSEHPFDVDFLNYLKDGMPSCAGIALGIDRLMMFFLDKKEIGEVMPFSFKYFKESGDMCE